MWRPPSKTSINGEFLGYRIAYRPRNDNLSHQSTEMLLKDPEVTQFTILDLSPFTQYLVSLQVVNPAGLGPPTKVVVMTDEGGKFLSELWFSLHQQLGNAWYKINYSLRWQQVLTPFYIKYHQFEKKKLVAKIVVKFDYVFALFSKRIGLDSVRVKKLFSILKSYGKSLSSAKKKKVDWLWRGEKCFLQSHRSLCSCSFIQF